jgi:peptidoglycan hydrolase-like protein with peptidoglycan-binding domain
MALQSQLFRGDPKLEAAAVSDPAHILPGARGPHVGKIQRALNALDDAGLDEDSAYGPATAAAVLAYKRERDIVNRSYQTQADNIVGKMTIAAMDKEMLQWERERTIVKTTIYCKLGKAHSSLPT